MAKRVLLERDKVNPVWERLLHIPVPPLATTSTFRYYMYLHVARYGTGAPATCNTTCTYVAMQLSRNDGIPKAQGAIVMVTAL